MKTHAGFTLIETVFAIFVFSIGALGFAATTAVVLRSLGVASARERAAREASSRLETIRSLGCSAKSGNEAREGFQSSWTVSPSQAGVSATARVTYAAAGATKTDIYTASFPCGE